MSDDREELCEHRRYDARVEETTTHVVRWKHCFGCDRDFDRTSTPRSRPDD